MSCSENHSIVISAYSLIVKIFHGEGGRERERACLCVFCIWSRVHSTLESRGQLCGLCGCLTSNSELSTEPSHQPSSYLFLSKDSVREWSGQGRRAPHTPLHPSLGILLHTWLPCDDLFFIVILCHILFPPHLLTSLCLTPVFHSLDHTLDWVISWKCTTSKGTLPESLHPMPGTVQGLACI